MTGDYRYIPPKPPLGFTVGILAGFGGLAGLMTAQGDTGLMLPFLAIGAALFAAFSFAVTQSFHNCQPLIISIALPSSNFFFGSLTTYTNTSL